MSREAHVRFCESLGLQRPGPLTKKATHKRKKMHHRAKQKEMGRAERARSRMRGH